MAPPSKRQRGTFEDISRLTLPSPLHILHGTETMHLPVDSLMFLLNTTLLARDCSYRRMKRRDQGGQTWVNGSYIVRERLPFTYDRGVLAPVQLAVCFFTTLSQWTRWHGWV